MVTKTKHYALDKLFAIMNVLWDGWMEAFLLRHPTISKQHPSCGLWCLRNSLWQTFKLKIELNLHYISNSSLRKQRRSRNVVIATDEWTCAFADRRSKRLAKLPPPVVVEDGSRVVTVAPFHGLVVDHGGGGGQCLHRAFVMYRFMDVNQD